MTTWQKGPVDISVGEARYDGSKIPRIEAHYGRRIEAGTLQAASFLMARGGKIFAHQAAGNLTHRPDSPPFTVDTIRCIASISKVVTATAVMKLVEDGVLWLDQPVKEFIPEFDTPIHGKITVRHLLTHTSGLPADGGYFTEPYPVDRYVDLEKSEWLKKILLAGPLQSDPGKHWAYCSLGFGVLAEVVSRVSGLHFNDFVQQKVFAPLGMTRSFFEVPEALWPEVSLMADWDHDRTVRGSDRSGMPRGGGGAFSTLHDLFVLGQMSLNGGTFGGTRVLGKKTVQEMTRNQLAGVPAFHWGKHLTDFRHGLGWGFYCDGSITGPATYNHQGWGASYLFVDPVEDFVFALFAASPNDWNPELLVEPVNIAFSGLL